MAPTTTSGLSLTVSTDSLPQSDGSVGGAVGTSEQPEDSGIDRIGLGVGIGAAVLFLIALILLVIALLMRRRRERMQPLPSTSDTSSGAGRLSEYGSTELVAAQGKRLSVPQYGGMDLSHYAAAPVDKSERSHEYGAFSDSQREHNKIQYDAVDTPLM